MPTQMLSRRTIVETFGEIQRFEAPRQDHPVASGLPPGTVTDDTEQAVLLGRLLGPDAHLDQLSWERALLDWEERMRARGSLDLLGPSTTAALHARRSGTPADQAGVGGTTNGAAMRICPVGIAVDSTDLGRLVDRVVEASMLTHNTSLALAGAAAVAAAVSACLDGATVPEAVGLAVRAAELGAVRGRWVAGASVARRIEWAADHGRWTSARNLPDLVADLVGTSLASQESVPAAFAILAAFPKDPWKVVCTAASVGGDCDTIAAMAGAMAGAALGVGGFPDDAVQTVREVNHLDLDELAGDLLALR
ncbi:MAG: hypothetical protein QOI51_472 [Nocardioidaceae bacterium]|jgi:ADP-ribosylglycohydrolase|nr:hypothetical protein [Nocardioidaceae bacterium]